MNNISKIRKLSINDVKESKALVTVNKFLSSIPIPKDGKDGKDGKDAPSLEKILSNIPVPKDGKDAPDLKTILEKVKPLLPSAASNGLDGSDGEDGFTPDHELDQKRLRIRFTNPDGTWGDWLEIGKELSKLIARQIGAYSYRGGGSSSGGTSTASDSSILDEAEKFDADYTFTGSLLTLIEYANTSRITSNTKVLNYTGSQLDQTVLSFIYEGKTWTFTIDYTYEGSISTKRTTLTKV